MSIATGKKIAGLLADTVIQGNNLEVFLGKGQCQQ